MKTDMKNPMRPRNHDHEALEMMRAEILNLWRKIEATPEEDRRELRARYTRAYEYYRSYRLDLRETLAPETRAREGKK